MGTFCFLEVRGDGSLLGGRGDAMGASFEDSFLVDGGAYVSHWVWIMLKVFETRQLIKYIIIASKDYNSTYDILPFISYISSKNKVFLMF